MNADEKACPDCAETIKSAAKVCKHCGHRLDQHQAPSPAEMAEAKPKPLDIFYCPSCKKPTPQAAGKCRHCKAKFDNRNSGAGKAARRSHQTFDGDPKPLFAGCGVVALVVCGLLLSQCGDAKPEQDKVTESDTSEREPDNFDLKYAAQQNLKALMKDSDSAKFEGVFLSRIDGGNLMLCGRVNSKNSFGAFTGFQRFIASPNPAAPSVIDNQASGLSPSDFAQAYAAACSNVVERF